ncbi:MAG: 50S ribosomal protein L9 [Anaerolineales bacterium]
MKVLLLRDVYKLGHAGDVKKVADGYARNYLLPRRLAIPATAGALKQADRVRAAATELRVKENREKAGLAERLADLQLAFPVRASEQGKLYGSVTHQMIADAITTAVGESIDRRSIMSPPLRQIGEYHVPIRLTSDLVPNVHVLVHHEDQAATSVLESTPAAATAPTVPPAAESETDEAAPEDEPVAEVEEVKPDAVEAAA